IVNYTHEILPGMLEVIRAHHTPAVWLNAKLAEDCVYPDAFGAARNATADLIGLGHRRIAFVKLIAPWLSPGATVEQTLARMHYSIAARRDGYLTAMREAGLAPQVPYLDRLIPQPEQLSACRALLAAEHR